jgi:hypothetical protein
MRLMNRGDGWNPLLAGTQNWWEFVGQNGRELITSLVLEGVRI